MGKNFDWTRRVGRAVVVCGMVGGTITALTPLAQASSGGTLYVNAGTGTDSGTCRLSSSPCATISYALTQATTGSLISVAPGQYPQPLQITKKVTIEGEAATDESSTIINPSSLINDTNPANPAVQENAIIDVSGVSGVTLKYLTVDGQNAQGDFNGCSQDFSGVYYHDASGTMNTDTVTNIQLPPADFGCQDGQGVYVATDTSDTSNVTMAHLTVNAFDKNGVSCWQAGTTCALRTSTITGIGPTSLIAQNGFVAVDASSVTLASNTVKSNSYTGGGGSGNAASGILVYDVGAVSVTGNHASANDVDGYFGDDGTGPTAGTWTISGNSFTGATDNVTSGPEPGYGDGLDLDSTTNAVTLSSNTLTGNYEYGIALTGVTGATVSTNTAQRNGSDGIYIGGPGSVSGATNSTGNMITGNTSNANKADGILADTDSTANTFQSNVTAQNVTFDLQDQGTANVWTSNTCRPTHDSNPAGLC